MSDTTYEEQPPKARRRVLLIAFMTVCLDLLGFGIIIPIQPFYAESYGASPTLVTWLGASYSLMQFVFAPFWGRLSDRIGRRPVILVSILFGVAGYVAFGLAGSLPILFAARMLSGFGNANIATVQAVIADTTSGADRAKGMGLIGAAFGLGFIFGPALGGLLGQWGLAWPAFGAAALGALNWVLAFALLPETRPQTPHAGREDELRARVAPWGALARLRRHANVGRLALILLIVTTGFALMEQALGLFIERVWVPEALTAVEEVAKTAALREAAAKTSWYLVFIGVVVTVVQGGLIGRLSKKFGEKPLINAGLVINGLGLALLPVAGLLGSWGLMFPVGFLMAVGSGISTPSLNSLLSRSVEADEQGMALGVGQSSSALGRVLGPAASGFLLEQSLGVPFWAGAGLLWLAAAASLGLRATKKSA
jgi:DHA1 family tetracycline resistance protein-like MFS transporter